MSERKASTHLNYKGDHRGSVGRLMGPTLNHREYVVVVDAEYDAESNRTRLGLAYLPKPDPSLIVSDEHGFPRLVEDEAA